jgi:C1A family cysteine protease
MPAHTPNIVHFDHPEGGRTVKVGACHRDPHRPEHKHYDSSQFAPDELPGFVDLRPHLTPVEDQGDLGSCTANALAGAVEYLERRLNNSEERVSRLFLYWNERDLEGTANQDHGACLDDGIRALQKDGICTELIWPYDTRRVFKKPHDDAYDAAEGHTIDEAHRVKIELHDLRHCLAEGYPFVFGLQLGRAFQKVGDDGVVALPDAGDNAGGHAMLCVGYSDQDQVFVVRNSWGPKWGDGGYCYIPYEYLGDPKYAHDAWTLRRAHDLDFNQGAAGAEPPHGARASFFEDDDSGEDGDDTGDTGDAGGSADTGDTGDTDDTGDADNTDDTVDPDDSDTTDADESDTSDSSGDSTDETVEQVEEELEEALTELQQAEKALEAQLAKARKKR